MKDGSAIMYSDGTQFWLKNDELHRTDGPAYTHPDGEQRWYQNGKLHRTDGPACIYSDGSEVWHHNGRELSESEVLIIKEGLEFDKMMKDMLTEEIV